jgi:hypothetical protein
VKLRHWYLALAIVGLVLPYSQFVPWLFAERANLPLLLHELFANRMAAGFALDVIVSALVVIAFVLSDGRRLGMRGLWLPIVGVVLAGVSFALPLFLYMRERQIERSGAIAR